MSKKFEINIINDDLTEADVYMALEDYVDELIENGDVDKDIKIVVRKVD